MAFILYMLITKIEPDRILKLKYKGKIEFMGMQYNNNGLTDYQTNKNIWAISIIQKTHKCDREYSLVVLFK